MTFCECSMVCIARICVSDNPIEIIRMVGFANDYISMLAQSNMLKIQAEKGENDAEIHRC